MQKNDFFFDFSFINQKIIVPLQPISLCVIFIGIPNSAEKVKFI